MKSTRYSLPGFLVVAAATCAPALAAPSIEELYKIIQEQQKQIKALESKVDAAAHQAAEADKKIEAAGAQIEEASQPVATAAAVSKTAVGGYGELHYNNLNGDGGASDLDEIDFHRFVLFFGHAFNDRTRFFSELEIEHALVEDTDDGSGPGEVELEQAYLEYDVTDALSAKGGLFLVPVGILNETHEPPTFYGVERNPVEAAIIPSTWWEGGAGLSGSFGDGFSFDFALHSGLKTSIDSKYAVRSGRQKVARASADDLAATGRLKWTAIPGVEVAGSIQYQEDITQSTDPLAGSALLYETHVALAQGPFGLRALYALWDLDGSGPASVGADEQSGFYIEPSFKPTEQIGLFARYNLWDNRAGGNFDSEKTQWDVGVNYWLHPQVVLKADYQMQDNDDGKDRDGFNLGIGYQF